MIGFMDKIHALAEDKRKLQKHIVTWSVLFALVVSLCIFIILYVNMHSRYASYRDGMQEDIYSCMQEMVSLYDSRNDTGASLQRIIIPDMRALFKTAQKYSSLLETQFGTSSPLLTQDRIDAFDHAFAEFITAYNAGTTTGLAEADMLACIEVIRPEVEAHYLPKTTTPPPVEITYNGEQQG